MFDKFSRRFNMRKLVVLFLAAMLIVPALSLSAGGQGEGKKKGFVVALSNSFYGNSWRKQMVDTMQVVAAEAKAKGLISDFIVANGDGTENTQIAQMNSLILQNVDAILINSASLTGLNGVIAKAHEKGIKVMAFDSIASSPYAYKLEFNFASFGTIQAKYIVDRFKGKAKILIGRGVMGSAPEIAIYDGMMSIFKANPGIEVVGEIDTEADNAKAQSGIANVLPSLPQLDAVVGEGGYGAIQAFLSANKAVPVVIGNNRAEFIQWWIDEKAKNGYETISISSEPSIGAIAFWVMIHILQGEKVPEMIQQSYQLPMAAVTNATVDKYNGIKPGTVIAQTYTDQWVIDNILNKK
jgi:ribose transport system substrate-binding protein